MSNRYSISMRRVANYFFEVEADSENEAREKAYVEFDPDMIIDADDTITDCELSESDSEDPEWKICHNCGSDNSAWDNSDGYSCLGCGAKW